MLDKNGLYQKVKTFTLKLKTKSWINANIHNVFKTRKKLYKNYINKKDITL